MLYYEDGLWLSIERGGRVQTGFPLIPDAEEGEILIAGRTLLALAHGPRDACLALNERFEPLGRVEADRIYFEEGAPVSVEALDSLCGYERRTRWQLEDGALTPGDTRTGFFTREPVPQAPGARFLEALLYGSAEEAEALLSPSLGLHAEDARGFLGEFSFVRPHPAHARLLGVARHTDGVTRMRTLTIETDGDQIVNILEES